MKVLFLGAHCDDIELGCGATIHKHASEWEITAVTLCRTGVEGRPARRVQNLWKTSKKSLLSLGAKDVRHLRFPICNYYRYRQEIWEAMRALNEEVKPELVFTHANDDSRDHQVTYAESIRNFEQSSMYLYVPSITTGPTFCPKVFEPLSESDLKAKVNALANYSIYRGKRDNFSKEVLRAQCVLYGTLAQCKHAEAFELFRKIRV